MMRQAYGLTEDDINVMLGTDTDPKTEFSSDEDFDAKLFEQVAMQFGSDEAEFVTLKSRPVAFHSQGVPMEFEEVLPENKELDTKILAIVKKTKKVEADQIAKETGAPLEKVTERIEYLIGKGKISIINRIATIARESPLPTEDVILETRYKYDLRPGTSGNKILPNGRTRKFCETLIRLNKVYTREDIDQMSAIMGFSVWDRRGGWYTLPGTDLARPSCRHIWQQQLVRRVGNKIQTVES
jgi:DNA-binding Lrp family transcriptional regulator